MQTLVQSRATRSYFEFPTKRWVPRRSESTIFESETEAIRACMREGLPRVQLVLLGDDSTGEVVVPLDREGRFRPSCRVFE